MPRRFISLTRLLIACALLAPLAARTPARAAASIWGYWHTNGTRIVDGRGNTVRIAAVNWFGMEDAFFVPAGLVHRPLDSILGSIQRMGFNAIRLPFSNQLVEQNPIVHEHVQANPQLIGLHALDLLDRIVHGARRHHLRIILDNGRSSSGTQPEADGLWYTPQYPESAWLHDWQTLALRYKGNPTVVAADLRNEPHTAPPGPWSLSAYLHQGATWGPYSSIDNTATDWRLAAERGGNAVLKVNPNLLIVVEGLQLYPDPAQPLGVDSYWWGGILSPAASYPVSLAIARRLVYSPHEYGPMKWPMRFFGRGMTYASMSAVWNRHWGFLLNPNFRYRAPVFLGEFGTCALPRCVSDRTPGSQGLWFSFLMRYLREHARVGWAFWALNGTSHVGDNCPNYILTKNWRSIRQPALLKAFATIGRGR